MQAKSNSLESRIISESSTDDKLPKIQSQPQNMEKFQCKWCQEDFSTNVGLELHVPNFHRALKPIKCTECGIWYTIETIKEHIETIHSKEKKETDKVCITRHLLFTIMLLSSTYVYIITCFIFFPEIPTSY